MQYFYFFFIFILGISFGSFMNTWVWRTKENLGVARARSMCTGCRKLIRWYDNIPLVSFVLLRGRCRNCDDKIGLQYPLVEICTGLMFLFVVLWHHPVPWNLDIAALRDVAIIYFLTFIFLYDLKYQEILNFQTIPSGIILFIASIGFGWATWHSMLIGVLIGAGFFLTMYVISKGKWIGGGDVRLGFFMGSILGWPKILVALFLAYLIGAVFNSFLIVMGKKTLKSETPFGTYLVVGTAIAMFFGEFIIDWYIELIT